MDDLISRQAAIDALEREKTYCTAFRDGYTPINVFEKYNAGLTDGIKALKNLPSAQQWIPCSERLPERGKDVLVTRDYDGREDYIKSCRYVEVASCYGEDGDITWNSFSDEYKMRPRNHHVVAWMPLPEPYKGESNETD